MKDNKQENNTIKLKEKELEILVLLYRFRFLNRSHLQTMLNHKYRSKVQSWLNELVESCCVKNVYEKKFAGGSAIYYLAPLGRKQLKTHPKVKTKLLDSRVWREEERTQEFREHCLFIADINLSLLAFAEKTKSVLSFFPKTDLYGRRYVIRPNPDAYFALTSTSDNVKRYFLDSFNEIPPAQMRKRIHRFFEYYDSEKWFEEYPDKPFPEIILVVPNIRMKGHLYLYIQSKLDEYEEVGFYLVTKETVANKGLVRETLERVVIKD